MIAASSMTSIASLLKVCCCFDRILLDPIAIPIKKPGIVAGSRISPFASILEPAHIRLVRQTRG